MRPKVDPRTGKAVGGRKPAFQSHIVVEPPKIEEIYLSDLGLDVEEEKDPELAIKLEFPPIAEETKPVVPEQVKAENLEFVKKSKKKIKNALDKTK